MRRILLLIAAFAVWDCRKAGQEAALPRPGTDARAEQPIGPAAEPVAETAARRPILWPQPLHDYRKYIGKIDGQRPITLELTLQDHGLGLHAHGSYYNDLDGAGKPVHADFHDTDRFEFTMYDSAGNHVVEALTGRFKSLDSFAGDWTRYQPDSIQDQYGFWKKTRIPRERGSFKLLHTVSGSTPVTFQVHRRGNDSGSKARIREGRIEFRTDSLPSRLQLIHLRVRSGRDSVDSLLNLSSERSLKEFCLSIQEEDIPGETPIPAFVDSLFSRDWVRMEGRFFSESYETELLANVHGVLSLRYAWSSYAGGAHGSDDHLYATLDVTTGRKLGLKDLLVPDYHDRLGSLAGVPSCDEDPEREYPCTLEGLVKKGFAVVRNGILFHASMGLDERDVLVSHADLAPLIKPGGILERFRK